jgi:hypothetical protein
MRIVHFTPAATAAFGTAGRTPTVAHLPLASGHGEIELSCLYLAPGGTIAVPASRRDQLLLMVNGRANAGCIHQAMLLLSAGMGLLLPAGEFCTLSSRDGSILLVLDADQLVADPCGLSHPELLRGALWPQMESNGADPVEDD